MHGTFFPSSDEEIADNFPQETEHVCGRARTGSYDIKTHLIQYLILPGIQKIQLTCKCFWRQYPTFITTLYPRQPKPPIHRAEWAWVYPNTNMWCLYDGQSIFQTPTVRPPVNWWLIRNPCSWGRYHRLSTQDCPQFMPATWSSLTFTCDQMDKTGSKWPHFHVQ